MIEFLKTETRHLPPIGPVEYCIVVRSDSDTVEAYTRFVSDIATMARALDHGTLQAGRVSWGRVAERAENLFARTL